MKATILVGNGPTATARRIGWFVDSFDCVVRFNKAHIDGFQDFLGHRTDIWALNAGTLAHPGQIEWSYVLKPARTMVFGPKTFPYLPHWRSVAPPGTELCSEAIAEAADAFLGEGKWASTSLIAILAFRPCAIIGFDSFSGPKHHYGDEDSFHSYHDGAKEAAFIRKLVDSGDLVVL